MDGNILPAARFFMNMNTQHNNRKDLICSSKWLPFHRMANGKAMSQAAHNVVALMGQNVSFFSKPQPNEDWECALVRQSTGRYSNVFHTDLHLGRISDCAKLCTAVE
jgi:hypothetical protein